MLSTAYIPILDITISLEQNNNKTFKMNRIGNPILPSWVKHGYRMTAILNGEAVVLICDRHPINFFTFKMLTG